MRDRYGNIIGTRTPATITTAKSVWSMNEQIIENRDAHWPKPIPASVTLMNFISGSEYVDDVNPTNTNSFVAGGSPSFITDGSYPLNSYGGKVLYIVDSGYLQVAASFLFSGDLTIEFWAKTISGSGRSDLMGNWAGGGTNSWEMGAFGSNLIYTSTGASENYTSPGGNLLVNDDTWHHYAFVRNGTTHDYYIDGVQPGSSVTSTAYPFGCNVTGGGLLRYGQANSGSAPVYLGAFRYMNVAHYTSNFTPPSSPFAVI